MTKKASCSCPVTSTVCQILHLKNMEIYFALFDLLRERHLKSTEIYKDFLYEYDKIGPIISTLLLSEEHERKINFANRLFYEFINPIIEQIWKANYEGAALRYREMIEILKELYKNGIEEMTKNFDNNKKGYNDGKQRKIKKVPPESPISA